mgnify:FL=1
MPKRTTLPQFSGDCKFLVQKSNPLQSLSETKMTLAEFKILDAYLSKIDSRKPEERSVTFDKGELESLLGVTQIKNKDLSNRIDNLFKVVTIQDPDKPNKFTKIVLFSCAECTRGDDGLWTIKLACSPEAMEYIFNIESIGYLRYRLKNVVNLTSRYSYILYLYLESNRFRGSWTIPLDALKKMLCCTADTYSEYKRFSTMVLKKCQKELSQKTDIDFDYVALRRGRKVSGIQFILKTSQNAADSPVEALFEERDEFDWAITYGSERLATLAEGCNYEFNKAEMEQIARVLVRINIPCDQATKSELYGKQFYLREKYAALNVIMCKKPIKNRFKYFLKMLESDAYQPISYNGI